MTTRTLEPAAPKRTSQGPFAMWHGMTLGTVCRMLARRPRLHWRCFPRIALIPPLCASNSLWAAVEALVYGRRIRRTRLQHAPLFIIGHWRSGTTLLHTLITRDPQFTCPNMYQTTFPSHFLTTERLVARLTAPLIPKSRPMDNVEVGWGSPQEDEIALCNLSLISPYLLTAFYDRPEEYDPYYELADVPPAVRQRWKDAFEYFLKKLALRDPRPVVLKSPTHTFRIPLLREMFPRAKFVHIVREPFAVFNSTVHVTRALVEENWLGPLDLSRVEEECLRHYEQCFRCYERDRRLVPPGQLHELRFEDLERDPLGELRKVYSTLGLDGFERLEAAIVPDLDQFRRYRKNRFPEDGERARMVYERCRFAYDRFGYPPPFGAPSARAAG